MLQTTKAIFGDQDVMCALCRTAPDGRVHFLMECKDLEDIRLPLLQEIQDYLPTSLLATKKILTNEQLLTQLILDPTQNSIKSLIQIPKDVMQKMEAPSRLMCYRIHYRRAQTLGYRH